MANGRPGPAKISGRFKSREVLELYVIQEHEAGEYTKVIAEKAGISIGTATNIIKDFKARQAPPASAEKPKPWLSRKWL